MKEAFFAIRDGSKRKAKPCAFMRWTAGQGFQIDIQEEASADAVPAFFIPFVRKGDLSLDSESSDQWVGERIPPTGRQNLGEILDAHSLSEYSEVELLRSSRGESSQDSFIVQEIDAESYEKRKVDKASARRKALGKAIKERRANLGLSQRELADELGISQPALSKIEAGMANITFDLLTEIDDCLSGDEPSFLRIPAANLWTRERRNLLDELMVLSRSCGEAYKEVVDLLEEFVGAEQISNGDAKGKTQGSAPRGADLLESSVPPLVQLRCNELWEKATDLTADIDWGEKASIIDAAESALSGLSDLGEEGCMSFLASAESLLTEYAEAFVQENEELFRLIAIANRIDGLGEHGKPLADQIAALAALVESPELHDIAMREIKNPHWRECLERYEYAVVDLSE